MEQGISQELDLEILWFVDLSWFYAFLGGKRILE